MRGLVVVTGLAATAFCSLRDVVCRFFLVVVAASANSTAARTSRHARTIALREIRIFAGIEEATARRVPFVLGGSGGSEQHGKSLPSAAAGLCSGLETAYRKDPVG